MDVPTTISIETGDSPNMAPRRRSYFESKTGSKGSMTSSDRTGSTVPTVLSGASFPPNDDVSSIGSGSFRVHEKRRAKERASLSARRNSSKSPSPLEALLESNERGHELLGMEEAAASAPPSSLVQDLAKMERRLAESEARNVELAAALEESILNADTEATKAKKERQSLKEQLFDKVQTIVRLELELETAEDRAQESKESYERLVREQKERQQESNNNGDNDHKIRTRLETFLSKLEAENLELREQLSKRPGIRKVKASRRASDIAISASAAAAAAPAVDHSKRSLRSMQ